MIILCVEGEMQAQLKVDTECKLFILENLLKEFNFEESEREILNKYKEFFFLIYQEGGCVKVEKGVITAGGIECLKKALNDSFI